VSQGVNVLAEEDPTMSVLLITHYQRLLNYIKPDVVHVMVAGKMVRTGGPDVAVELEEEGYAVYREFETV
jgi:Fe-S cluster assembly ATP-binding protein